MTSLTDHHQRKGSFDTLGAVEPQGKKLFRKLRTVAAAKGLESNRVNYIQDVLSVQHARCQARRLLIGGAALEQVEGDIPQQGTNAGSRGAAGCL